VLGIPVEGRSKGFGFVEMSTNEEAQKAIEALKAQICLKPSSKLSAFHRVSQQSPKLINAPLIYDY
jgi:RNA recognition motif-containing protein